MLSGAPRANQVTDRGGQSCVPLFRFRLSPERESLCLSLSLSRSSLRIGPFRSPDSSAPGVAVFSSPVSSSPARTSHPERMPVRKQGGKLVPCLTNINRLRSRRFRGRRRGVAWEGRLRVTRSTVTGLTDRPADGACRPASLPLLPDVDSHRLAICFKYYGEQQQRGRAC